jgi:hypothetical protein
MRNVTWVLFFAPDEPAFYHADWRPSFLTYPLPGPSTLAANTSTLVNFSIAVPASYSGTYGVGVAWAGERFETGPGFENGEWIYRDFTWSAPILDPITVAPAQHAQADGVPFLGTLQLGVVAALLAAVVRLNGRSKVP